MIAEPASRPRSDEPALAPDELIASIWLERRRWVWEGRIKQPHPLRVAMGQGTLSREALLAYVKNRYYFLANINRKDAQIIANCPHSEARRRLMRKYIFTVPEPLAEAGRGRSNARLENPYRAWPFLLYKNQVRSREEIKAAVGPLAEGEHY